ncbi:sigma-54-dependent Fis family transcriptional regulator [candidate division KSB1 bacterium]|nr:sigma-54-dependent Fis family transcriptional regulator [candidate division KSB1 bacterium]
MKILVIDDDKNIGVTLKWYLTNEGHLVRNFTSGVEGIEAVQQDFYDIIFLDVMMPGMGGLETLGKILEIAPAVKVFMISGESDITTAVRATKLGAYDFLEKPLNPEKISLEIKKLMQQQKIQAEVRSLKKIFDMEYKLIGESEPILALRDIIQRAAPSDGRILIYGENGTGKELVSRAIHMQSDRRDAPFIQLNCAALPKELIESELFGHEKGAFTGAHKKKPGLIEQAEGGTLLLDEVGDMALETQAKLLRVLQENEFFRVGGTKPQKFDVRIISATNKDLQAEIKNGNFRQDLYFRLNVIPVTVPSLRERKTDIPLLLDHFLKKFSIKNGKKIKTISPDAVSLLLNYHWPGNVRELENTVERLAIMTQADNIGSGDVRLVFGGGQQETYRENDIKDDKSLPLKDRLALHEKKVLGKFFSKCAGNVSQMALELQTDRANLHKKLKKYGIK